ncbi:MAG TPA: hypothetical protein VFK40_01325, partial [Nitrososphaeraceae archaeon]|nr:hypothetical protein [Nitrososphaeraceae archaeon]
DIDPSKIFIPAIMAESSEHIRPAIEIIDRSIDLGNLIKIYLRPEYKDAAIALSKIVNKLLDAFQNIIVWYDGFEALNLKNTDESKEEFLNFDRRFFKFRTGKEYDNIKLLCDDIGKIYREKLDKLLIEWFKNDPTKFYLAKEHFEEAEKIDRTFSQFIDEILERLKETVRSIKTDYINGKEKQKKFIEWSNNYLPKLEDQVQQLTKLKRELLNLTNVSVSDI